MDNETLEQLAAAIVNERDLTIKANDQWERGHYAGLIRAAGIITGINAAEMYDIVRNASTAELFSDRVKAVTEALTITYRSYE